ncbi:MAG: hypothetical protein IPN34_15805 [Planctomycetes bacterium]|nr:hypothetical protein [Planctomycetota bacterium]
MRAVFLASLAFALVGVGAWLVLSPAPGEPAPRALAESKSSGSSDAAGELRAELSTARAESLPASAGDPEIEASASRADSLTCAELFRPGDLWVRWLDREGRPTSAPDAVLVGREASDDLYWLPRHTRHAEQLWSIASRSEVVIALREQRARLRINDIFPREAFVEITYEPQRTTPHDLRLPPHASLVVVVENGALALPSNSSCKLSIANHGERLRDHRERSGTLGAELSIPRVSLDTELELTAIAFRKQLQETRVVRTPSVDGQTARVILSFGTSAPLLRGMVRDDLGAPLAETTLHALLKRGHEETGATLLTTPDGRFFWSPELAGDGPWRATLALSTSAGLRATVGELEIPATGVVDLGTLELHARSPAAPERSSCGSRIWASSADRRCCHQARSRRLRCDCGASRPELSPRSSASARASTPRAASSGSTSQRVATSWT